MSKLDKHIAALQKRVSALENQMKQDANLSEIRDMLADITKAMRVSGKRPGHGQGQGQGTYTDRDTDTDTDTAEQAVAPWGLLPYDSRRPPSHILQTRFRSL